VLRFHRVETVGCSSSVPGLAELGGDRRPHVVPEQFELVRLVGRGPDVDPLDTGMREGRELVGEQFGRAHRQAFSENLLGSVDRRQHPGSHHPFGLGVVIGDEEPHGGERVRVRVGILAVNREHAL